MTQKIFDKCRSYTLMFVGILFLILSIGTHMFFPQGKNISFYFREFMEAFYFVASVYFLTKK